VWDYLSRFTQWNDYVHRVIASVNGKEVYLPINIETMERLYGRKYTPEELQKYFEEKRLKLDEIKNSRDVVVSQVGVELYELLFKNYTKKQWGVYPDELDPQVTKRLPVRFNRDTRYFTDEHQGIPKHGYTRMFEKMINNKNIGVLLNTDFKSIMDSIKFNKLVFTGPIDSFFDYKYGKLPYRSIIFKFETLDAETYQHAAVVNYPNEQDYTRITEFKHFYFQRHDKTTICYEYSHSEGDPYYPIPKLEFQNIYGKYKREADKLQNVYFVGRLAEFRYLNMDQVVERALNIFKELI
jgi:UDP-galactopyranose mutase